MKTYRITENEIKGMKVLATGYKAFRSDWTSRHGNYSYADKNGEVLNSIHKVDGELIMCENGLHFSHNPLDCFKYYESVQWNKFAKVEVYGELRNAEDKSIARILKIIKIYTFDEFIDEIKEINNHITEVDDMWADIWDDDMWDDSMMEDDAVQRSCNITGSSYVVGGSNITGCRYIKGGSCIKGGNYIYGGNDVYASHDIKGGDSIYGGSDIKGGSCIKGGDGIYGGYNIYGGNAIYGSCDIRGGNDIRGGYDIYGGTDIFGGYGIWGGCYINGGYDIHGGRGIYGGYDIRGGYDISGCNNVVGGCAIMGGYKIWGAQDCEGVSKCIFCYNFTGKLHAFNKPITEERFEEIWGKLNSFGWMPDFTNANKLKGDKEWEEVDAARIKGVYNKEAWSAMPDEMKAYIKSLPEFDEAIFKAITED